MCLKELWQVDGNEEFEKKIIEMFEKENIHYISTPRTVGMRGGGAALACREDNFTLSKCNVTIPAGVECVWGIVRPRTPSKLCNQFICCSFYSPPWANRNFSLIDHMTVTLQMFLTKYPKSGVLISGDRNHILMKDLREIESSLKQIVTRPTRKKSILDVILTNLSQYYEEPVILPPVMPDIPGVGKPSDHDGVLAKPSRCTFFKKEKIIKQVRPISDSKMHSFGEEFVKQKWDFLNNSTNSTEIAHDFEKKMHELTERHFPLKQISISSFDKPFFTEELRSLKRKRQRRYRNHGKDEIYTSLKVEFDEKLLTEKRKYRDKLLTEVSEGRRGSAYSALKRMSMVVRRLQRRRALMSYSCPLVRDLPDINSYYLVGNSAVSTLHRKTFVYKFGHLSTDNYGHPMHVFISD